MPPQVHTDPQGRQYTILRDHYIYPALFGSLAFGASATVNINIETDAPFVCVKLTASADIAGAVQTANSRVLPLCNLSVTDGGSGRNLQSQPVPLMELTGDGQLPFVLPIPRRFAQNATINLTLDNVSAATTYDNLTVSLIGYKEFMQYQS